MTFRCCCGGAQVRCAGSPCSPGRHADLQAHLKIVPEAVLGGLLAAADGGGVKARLRRLARRSSAARLPGRRKEGADRPGATELLSSHRGLLVVRGMRRPWTTAYFQLFCSAFISGWAVTAPGLETFTWLISLRGQSFLPRDCRYSQTSPGEGREVRHLAPRPRRLIFLSRNADLETLLLRWWTSPLLCSCEPAADQVCDPERRKVGDHAADCRCAACLSAHARSLLRMETPGPPGLPSWFGQLRHGQRRSP